MAIIVIGGQSRDVGKTTVVAGLITALPQCNWSAFKITQFGHGRCSLDGKPCSCATDDRCWAMTEEKVRDGKSDTSRFLAAGAKRSFWVRTEQGRLAEALSLLRRRIADSENVIMESNSIVEFIEPDLYMTVLDPGVEDFKVSAQRFLERADAVIVPEGRGWEQASHQRTFPVRPPQYVTDEIIEFVSQKLQGIPPSRY
jgi:molybdopterin-guanine dinucleotide biosynthesis protein